MILLPIAFKCIVPVAIDGLQQAIVLLGEVGITDGALMVGKFVRFKQDWKDVNTEEMILLLTIFVLAVVILNIVMFDGIKFLLSRKYSFSNTEQFIKNILSMSSLGKCMYKLYMYLFFIPY